MIVNENEMMCWKNDLVDNIATLAFEKSNTSAATKFYLITDISENIDKMVAAYNELKIAFDQQKDVVSYLQELIDVKKECI